MAAVSTGEPSPGIQHDLCHLRTKGGHFFQCPAKEKLCALRTLFRLGLCNDLMCTLWLLTVLYRPLVL